MVARLLKVQAFNADAADALAIAIAASNDAGKPARVALRSGSPCLTTAVKSHQSGAGP